MNEKQIKEAFREAMEGAYESRPKRSSRWVVGLSAAAAAFLAIFLGTALLNRQPGGWFARNESQEESGASPETGLAEWLPVDFTEALEKADAVGLCRYEGCEREPGRMGNETVSLRFTVLQPFWNLEEDKELIVTLGTPNPEDEGARGFLMLSPGEELLLILHHRYDLYTGNDRYSLSGSAFIPLSRLEEAVYQGVPLAQRLPEGCALQAGELLELVRTVSGKAGNRCDGARYTLSADPAEIIAFADAYLKLKVLSAFESEPDYVTYRCEVLESYKGSLTSGEQILVTYSWDSRPEKGEEQTLALCAYGQAGLYKNYRRFFWAAPDAQIRKEP